MNEFSKILDEKTIESKITKADSNHLPTFDKMTILGIEKLTCYSCNKVIGIISEFDGNGTTIFCTDCGLKVERVIKRKYGDIF